MTGLLRTSLFFFLPVFGVLTYYHTRVAETQVELEQKQDFLKAMEPVLAEASAVVGEALSAGSAGEHDMPPVLGAEGVILLEVLQNGSEVLRFIDSSLASSPNWSMLPDSSVRPEFQPGFLLSVPSGQSLKVLLLEDTAYDKEAQPVFLKVYVREASAVGDES